MRMNHSFGPTGLTILVVALLGSTNTLAQSASMVAPVAAEATVYESQPGNNGGGYSRVCVGNVGSSTATRRALVRYDLSGIPEGAVVTRVELVYRQVRVRDMGAGPVAATLEIRRATENWTEGSGGISMAACGGGSASAGVTWNTMPAVMASPSASAAMPTADAFDIVIDTDTGAANDALINDVQGWLDGTFDNSGWMLRVNEENAADNARLVSTRTLTIHYTVDVEPVFNVNAGLNDAWFNAATNGQGFFFTVFPDVGLIFVSWFTYDTVRPDEDVMAVVGEPGHRWLTAIGTWEGNVASLTFELTTGGVFDSSLPEPVQEPGYGTLEIVFHDCNSATATYSIPSAGQAGSIDLTRVVEDNVALCEVLAFE